MNNQNDNVMGLINGAYSNETYKLHGSTKKSTLLQKLVTTTATLAITFTLTSAGGANAADVVKKYPNSTVPVMSPASFEERWSGFYVGASVGAGWGETDTFYDRNGNDHLTPETNDVSGYMASFTFGYNHQFANNFVIGLEGDIGIMDLSAPDRQNLWDGHVWKSQYGGLWGSLRPRVGYAYNKFLVFATGGVAFMETDEMILGDNDATQNTYNQGVHTGWVLGAGVEYALTEKISAKLEYLHMEFPEYRGYTNNNELYGFQNSVDLVRVGMNYKF